MPTILGMSRRANDDLARSIDISHESEGEEDPSQDEEAEETEEALHELEENQHSKFDVFASNSKDKDRVIHK